jgi:hypothetical protein
MYNFVEGTHEVYTVYRVLERRRWKDNINMNLNEMDRMGERVDKIGSGSGPEVGFSYRSANLQVCY